MIDKQLLIDCLAYINGDSDASSQITMQRRLDAALAAHHVAADDTPSKSRMARVAIEKAALSPIERDESYDRTYIPLPGGWEVQTKGGGSTFRIAGPDNFRLPIPDSPYLHETLECMARDIQAACSQPAAQGEPVAFIQQYRSSDGQLQQEFEWDDGERDDREHVPLYTHPPQQPKGKPAAWIVRTPSVGYTACTHKWARASGIETDHQLAGHKDVTVTPLYEHPLQQQARLTALEVVANAARVVLKECGELPRLQDAINALDDAKAGGGK